MQRHELASVGAEIETQLGSIDRGLNLVRSVATRPVMIGVGIAAVLLIGPRRILRLASRGALLFATSRRFLRLAWRAPVVIDAISSRRVFDAAVPLRDDG